MSLFDSVVWWLDEYDYKNHEWKLKDDVKNVEIIFSLMMNEFQISLVKFDRFFQIHDSLMLL